MKATDFKIKSDPGSVTFQITESVYKTLPGMAKAGRLKFPSALFAYPFYLWKRSPGKSGSHFDPNCDLFAPNERMEIITSTTCWFAMLTFLLALTAVVGPLWVFKLYFVPYWVYTSHSQPLSSNVLCIMATVVTLKFLVHTFLPQHIPHCDT
jgi:fatty acid desaturase